MLPLLECLNSDTVNLCILTKVRNYRWCLVALTVVATGQGKHEQFLSHLKWRILEEILQRFALPVNL